MKEKLGLRSHLLLFLRVSAKVWAVRVMSVYRSPADPGHEMPIRNDSFDTSLFIYF